MNINSLINLIVGLVDLAIIVYLIYLQSIEVAKPKDRFTPYRWTILFSLISILIMMIAPLAYQYVRAFGGDSDLLRIIAGHSSRAGFTAFCLAFLVIFKLKLKDE